MNIFTRICFTLFLFFVLKSASAQVGINTLNPDPNSVLDIQSEDKGVKLPQIKDISVLTPPADSSSYLIYDKTGKKFRSWNGRYWETVNPLQVDNMENVTAPKNLAINGTSVAALNANVHAQSFEGYGITPIGGLIMWSGDTINIPDGWTLCDGRVRNSQTTPDLTDKFIRGYNKADNYLTMQKTGGSDFLKLDSKNIPVHTHDLGTLHIDSAGEHTHDIWYHFRQIDGGTTDDAMRDLNSPYAGYSNRPTQPAGKHSHPLSGELSKSGGIYYPEQWHIDNTGSPDAKYTKENCTAYTECMNICKSLPDNPGRAYCISGCDSDYDSGNLCDRSDYNPNYGKKVVDSPEISYNQPFDNRPAYYVLAFIMRVK